MDRSRTGLLQTSRALTPADQLHLSQSPARQLMQIKYDPLGRPILPL
jgi:hypothetical protein